jgi:cytoskeletal protein CcmA (bactofilin family)
MKRLFSIIVLLSLFSFSLFAGEYRSNNSIRITDSLKTDLYAASEHLTISSPVIGDIWAGVSNAQLDNMSANNIYIAGGDIFINNSKFSSVLLMGGNIKFQGIVSGGMKVAGGTIFINGTIERDLIVAGGKVIIEKGAIIKGDVIGAGGQIEIYGNVEGNLEGAFGKLELYGNINKNVSVKIDDRIFIDDNAHIGGNLEYKSKKEFTIAKNLVGGNITHEITIKKEFRFHTIILALKLFALVSALIAALVIILLTKKKVTAFITSLDKNIFIPLVIGLVSVVALPIILLLLFGLIITIPIAMILMCLTCILLFTGKIFLAAYIGSKLLFLINKKEANIYLSAILGVVVLYGSFFIPYLGIILFVVASIWGFGIACKFIQQLFSDKA